MYYEQRGSIFFDGSKYVAKFPNRPCNFISWDDAMAYADWACLRPMTELEFTKAARGIENPLPNALPWGTNSKEKVQRIVDEKGDLVFANGVNESGLNDNNREIFGASYYWVMDLAGSLWERVITIGDEKGRNFTGLHGDGQLSGYGSANVANWPAGIEEAGGFGFRGGGFYTHDRSYHEFNPYSPVSYRMYGSWSGGGRVEAYGSRFVKTE
jgi:formylglycine-generating enzyme required for sulfatase activity